MRIECPTCETGFNVSDDQVGQKGLCPKCETKFVIPSDPEGEVEVLAEGKIPEEKPKKDKKREREEKEEPETIEEEPKEEPKKEKRKRDSSRLLDEQGDDDEFDTGGAGKAVGLLAIGLIIGLAIGFVLGRMTAGDKEEGSGGGDPKPVPESSGDTVDPFGLE